MAIKVPPTWIYPACQCEVRDAERNLVRIEQEAFASRRRQALPLVVPPIHAQADLSRFRPATELQKAALKSCVRYVHGVHQRMADGQGAYLYGLPGVGKSELMVAVGKEVERCGYHVVFFKAAKLVKALKGTGRSITDRFAEGNDLGAMLASVDLLLLDDIGKEAGWESEFAVIHSVLDDRWGNRKATWFTSEKSPNELAEHLGRYGDGFMSRLSACVEVFEYDGEDLRPGSMEPWR